MKFLITGASGFLGKRTALHLQLNHNCITPAHKELELTNAVSCMEFLNLHTPDYVIHTAAISDIAECEKNPDLSYQINVLGTLNLAKACRKTKSRMIFMSSDQVYNGNHAVNPNVETDLCTPANVYGKHKLEAEQRLLEMLPDALALRLTWLYDLPLAAIETKANFLTMILDAINKNQVKTFSNDDYRGIDLCLKDYDY